MKNWIKSGVILALVLSLQSCGKEQLTPSYRPMTVNQLRNNLPLSFSYQIDDTQIDEFAKNAKKFPIFGILFQGIAIVLANSKISNKEGHELDLTPIELDLSNITRDDLVYLDWIKLNKLKLEIRDSKTKDSLEFINKIEIYAKLKVAPVGVPVDEEGYSRLLYFDNKEHALGCNNKCLTLSEEVVDWKEIIADNKIVTIKPKIIINSVPLSTMKLAGSIDFSIKLNLGF